MSNQEETSSVMTQPPSSSKATAALVYRPKKHDDWGYIRDADDNLVAIVRSEIGLTEDELTEHRHNKTDPCRERGEMIVEAVNSYNSSQALIAELREALEKIACFDDFLANDRLEVSGYYNWFDEPNSVKIARTVLAKSLLPQVPAKDEVG